MLGWQHALQPRRRPDNLMPRTRIVVTGSNGQVARSMIERAPGAACEIICIGRPTLDLANLITIDAIAAAKPDVLLSAAAYTDVNKAEAEPALADLINGRAPGLLAAHAHVLGIPLIHLSTDYVFDGTKPGAYTEADPICPINAYGRSKAAGERAIAQATSRHVILRTSWVYSPFGRNFVRSMLALAAQQDEVRVVADQIGNPTAAGDIADGVMAVAQNLITVTGDQHYGTFHMAAEGTASWAELAAAIFLISAERGGPSARVIPIASHEYPTPAQRPSNSRLDCMRIARIHGVSLPHWRTSLGPCIERILQQGS
jgi:dTDP-4-dehydrorhamnose reductase